MIQSLGVKDGFPVFHLGKGMLTQRRKNKTMHRTLLTAWAARHKRGLVLLEPLLGLHLKLPRNSDFKTYRLLTTSCGSGLEPAQLDSSSEAGPILIHVTIN